MDRISDRAYRLAFDRGSVFVKWLSADDRYARNELRMAVAEWKGSALRRPRLLHQIQLPGGSLGCWEWIEGDDLLGNLRTELPAAFGEVGRFHQDQRHADSVVSPTTHQRFDSLASMLEAETAALCRPLDAGLAEACAKGLTHLGRGYATWIHGDLHPGNIMRDEKGLVFTDWGYCIPSLNLFDLEYVQGLELGYGGTAYIAAGESEPLLHTYMRHAGFKPEDASELHLAVILWSELRMYGALVASKQQESAARSRQNIETILGEQASLPPSSS